MRMTGLELRRLEGRPCQDAIEHRAQPRGGFCLIHAADHTLPSASNPIEHNVITASSNVEYENALVRWHTFRGQQKDRMYPYYHTLLWWIMRLRLCIQGLGIVPGPANPTAILPTPNAQTTIAVSQRQLSHFIHGSAYIKSKNSLAVKHYSLSVPHSLSLSLQKCSCPVSFPLLFSVLLHLLLLMTISAVITSKRGLLKVRIMFVVCPRLLLMTWTTPIAKVVTSCVLPNTAALTFVCSFIVLNFVFPLTVVKDDGPYKYTLSGIPLWNDVRLTSHVAVKYPRRSLMLARKEHSSSVSLYSS